MITLNATSWPRSLDNLFSYGIVIAVEIWRLFFISKGHIIQRGLLSDVYDFSMLHS